MSRYAVIDLGTNTCNLLVANSSSSASFEILYDRKLPVKLGRGGIHKEVLLSDAIERGLEALRKHASTIDQFKVDKVKIIGTSALRGATNSNDFCNLVQKELGWSIEVISGDLEAELIFRGVDLSLPANLGPCLIIDIGGGSIEFIVAQNHTIHWKKSFNIGIARVIEAIEISDPITLAQIEKIEKWFTPSLLEINEVCQRFQLNTAVGCSGAFDTFMDIYEQEVPDQKVRKASELPIFELKKIHQKLIELSSEKRGSLIGMEPLRVEMIVIASVFTNFMVNKLNIEHLIHTPYSLKEGVMDQLISEE
jgi:exopolyphosphatase / guanosine-5'-triphosphate,3'-diphosphate pyrophosphatase